MHWLIYLNVVMKYVVTKYLRNIHGLRLSFMRLISDIGRDLRWCHVHKFQPREIRLLSIYYVIANWFDINK